MTIIIFWFQGSFLSRIQPPCPGFPWFSEALWLWILWFTLPCVIGLVEFFLFPVIPCVNTVSARRFVSSTLCCAPSVQPYTVLQLLVFPRVDYLWWPFFFLSLQACMTLPFTCSFNASAFWVLRYLTWRLSYGKRSNSRINVLKS